MNTTIRVRFAPSPTGPLHLGGVRTALYNFLFARKYGGKFILRIEDTDQGRFVPGAEQYILDSLAWCGISFDEGLGIEGPYKPYRQSERTSYYKENVDRLIISGHAYYSFDTPEELELYRIKASQSGERPFQYDYHSRNQLKNSLSLSESEVQLRISNGEPHVIRIKIPENDTVVFNDLIRGEVSVHTSNLDDKVLFKSDGLPTYHLANVVDDYLMKITHVIRGEEWLPSAPMHLLLYRFLGWEDVMPKFAHLPLILKPDGNGKLSKRDGDRLGFPVFPTKWIDPSTGDHYPGYREEGYLPNAFINMLALLGWNPGTEQEIFSIKELCSHFSLDRIHKSGSRFDPEKAKWFNHQYIQLMKDEELGGILARFAAGYSLSSDTSYCTRVAALIKERVTLLPDLWTQGMFFFHAPDSYDPQVRAKVWTGQTASMLASFIREISNIDPWNKENLHDHIKEFTSQHNIKMGQLMNPLRLLVVGSNHGPGIIDIAELLGKKEFLNRITKLPVD